MALTLTCPNCGKRNGHEFRYGGADKGPRFAEDGLTPGDWCDYVHMNTCIAGLIKNGGVTGTGAEHGSPSIAIRLETSK